MNNKHYLNGMILFMVCVFAGSVSHAMPSTETDIIFCNAMECFGSEESEQAFEAENDCIADECEYSVARVREQTDSLARSAPAYGFYRNQLCIADAACMDSVGDSAGIANPAWLGRVVRDFIEPLVNQEGQWRQRLRDCEGLPDIPGSGLYCQNLLAEYHIMNDLRDAVNSNGCGSEQDWDRIGELLNQCIAEGVEEDIILGFETMVELTAGAIVARERANVRNMCIAHRQDNGLNIEN